MIGSHASRTIGGDAYLICVLGRSHRVSAEVAGGTVSSPGSSSPASSRNGGYSRAIVVAYATTRIAQRFSRRAGGGIGRCTQAAREVLIADGSAVDPEAEAVEHEELVEVDDAVASLPARQREIVSRHFGLGRDAEEIAEVAADLHVSQQRARAIERDALYALRDRLEPAITLRPTR